MLLKFKYLKISVEINYLYWQGHDIQEKLITTQLTPWSWVILKLIVTHLVKKFPTFYGT